MSQCVDLPFLRSLVLVGCCYLVLLNWDLINHAEMILSVMLVSCPLSHSHAAGGASPDDCGHHSGCLRPPGVHLCPEVHPHWQHGGLRQSQNDTDLWSHVYYRR